MKSFSEIFSEWNNAFPFLKKYSPSTLYQKVGPFLIGLRLDKMADDLYRIYFEIMPLWLTERKHLGSIFLSDVLRKNGLQFSIFNRHHDLVFKEAVETAKKQYKLVLAPEIQLNDLIVYLESESENSLHPKKMKQLDRSLTFNIELAVALYLNKKELYNDIWENIIKESSRWDAEYFKSMTNMTIEEWLMEMHSKFDDRDEFMKVVEWNYQRPRVAKLNTGHIIGVEEYTKYVRKLTWFEKIRSLFAK